MSTVWLGCIVEGAGEEAALPVLIRRIAARIDPGLYVEVPRPFRIHRTRLGAQFGDLQNGLDTVIGEIQQPGGVLALFDADDDCPAVIGPALLAQLHSLRSDIPLGVVVAKREYEAWFLAAAESLRGQRGLPADLDAPPDPEAVRDAKGWLRRKMPAGRKYTERTDQPALTAQFDIDCAFRASDSFNKCHREIERLLRAIMPPSPPAVGTASSSPAPS